jgi:hypothetical protein
MGDLLGEAHSGSPLTNKKKDLMGYKHSKLVSNNLLSTPVACTCSSQAGPWRRP